jgi:hypothetical protein
MKETLNRLDVGRWDHQELKQEEVPGAIMTSVDKNDTPIIVRTNWNLQEAHFVLIDEVFDFLGTRYAAVCDPWDGDVHITKFSVGKQMDYPASAPLLSWSLYGEKHKYVGTSNGHFRGWVVRCVG